MSQIDVTDLTFSYENSFENIFEHVSFSIDTRWKLGFIGRNGKGKTTFLNLLLGKYEYSGAIHSSVVFDYFPYQLQDERLAECAADFCGSLKDGCELWRVACELGQLDASEEVLYRPFGTLSHGERTKVLLAVLFSGENDFLLVDEPTNHLDQDAREAVKRYLAGKNGFLLVSHDRDLLDACVDHVLVLNRCTIEVQRGNFSSWWENKARRDTCALMENEKHKKEIEKLKKASRRAQQWAERSERTKIGYDPVKEPDHANRAFIGEKTRKMQSRKKQMEKRMESQIRQQEGLLQDLEYTVDLKITPLHHPKELLVYAKDYGWKYPGASSCALEHIDLELRQGERLFISGKNGCGKSSLLKAVAGKLQEEAQALPSNSDESRPQGELSRSVREQKPVGVQSNSDESRPQDAWHASQGELKTASGLVVSYVSQDTSFLSGNIPDFCRRRNLEESLFCAVLRQLDIGRGQFAKQMEDFSEGQKKKVLLAASLLTPAHLYIWDEPLNYIDLFSRMQIEKLLLEYQPTMLVVEHDARFREQVSTRIVALDVP